ncbi:hypothetical protein YC2023_014609 [Brassica napus]
MFPWNSVGIFRRNSEEHLINSIDRCVFEHKRIDRCVYKKTLSLEYSEEVYPSEYSDDIFLGIFRGISDELVVLRISSEIHFFGIPSEISEGFPRKDEFPRSYFRGLFSSKTPIKHRLSAFCGRRRRPAFSSPPYSLRFSVFLPLGRNLPSGVAD